MVERAGEAYLYVPACRPDARSCSRLDSLGLVALRDVEQWLEAVHLRFRHPLFDPSGAAAPEAPPNAAIPGAIDGGAFIREDLQRLTALSPGALAPILAALDRFACFRGQPRDNAAGPRALVGAEAVELLHARRAATPAMVVREALEAGGLAGAYQGEHRFVGVIDRKETLDGQAGGYEAETAIVTLRVGTEKGTPWSYERQVVWSESHEGSPWS